MGKSSKYSRKTTRAEADASIVLDPPPSLRWRVWPLLDQPIRGAGVLAAMVLAGLITWWATGRPQLGMLATVALMAALWRFFLPSSFELNRHGLNQQRFGHQRRIPWKSIRRHERSQEGVLLLPHTDDCPLDRLRGLFLAWTDNRTEVLAHIDFHLGGRGE
ncbi:MAG: hypothetical protein U9N87_06105 [Planctomycetota bacterium]|nr:hypothetical protein [Planctomycetota bacterium]